MISSLMWIIVLNHSNETRRVEKKIISSINMSKLKSRDMLMTHDIQSLYELDNISTN